MSFSKYLLEIVSANPFRQNVTYFNFTNRTRREISYEFQKYLENKDQGNVLITCIFNEFIIKPQKSQIKEDF